MPNGVLRSILFTTILLAAACHNKAAAVAVDAGAAAPGLADERAELAEIHKSFRAFADAAYPQLRNAPANARNCHLQTSVARHRGPPRADSSPDIGRDTWSGMLSGDVRQGTQRTRLRVKFQRTADLSSWQCVEAGSRILGGPPGEPDAGAAPESVCAFLAASCGAP